MLHETSAASRPSSAHQQQRDLDALPGRIENLEAEIEDLQAIISLPDFYARAHEEVQSVLKELDGKSKDLEGEMESWLTLEKLRERIFQELIPLDPNFLRLSRRADD